jgi:type II restriction/modification system DNA methylase subunit YeeA
MVKAAKENIALILAEKEDAIRECKELRGILKPETLGFPGEITEDIDEMFRLYEIYCRIGYYSCKTVFLTQYAIDEGLKPEPRAEAEKAVKELREYREEVIKTLSGRTKFYHHIIFWLLNENRMKQLADDASGLLDGSVKQVISTFRKG